MSVSGLGGGGKRSANVELNLVPFIDLLSTLICFLLITAVWQQINALSTNSASTTTSDNPAKDNEKKVQFSVTLMTDHIELAEDQKITRVNDINGEPDWAGVTRILTDWKTRYPDRNDVILYSDSQAPYKHMIKLMDTLTGAQFDDVGVNTN